MKTFKKTPSHLLLLSLIATTTLQVSAQNIWQGTIDVDDPANIFPGTVDYQINTVTNTMTLLNKTGAWQNTYGPANVTTLYAVTSNPSAGLPSFSLSANPATSANFDVLNSHMASASSALALTANDGWFWASSTALDPFFLDLAIGANNWNYLDSDEIYFSENPSVAGHFPLVPLSAPPVLIPEPSTTFLLIAGIGIFTRRKR